MKQASLAIAVLVAAIVAPTQRAEACVEPFDCAAAFCGSDSNPTVGIVVGSVVSAGERDAVAAPVTLQLTEAYGDLDVELGDTVTLLNTFSEDFGEDVGASVTVELGRDPFTAELTVHHRLDETAVGECFAAGASVADIAAVVLDDQCEATLETAAATAPAGSACFVLGCAAGGSGGPTTGGLVSLALLGLVLAKRRPGGAAQSSL